MKKNLFPKLILTTFMMMSFLITVYRTSGFCKSYGQIFVEVQVQRSDGVGSCGSPPWGVDHINGGDFTCVPPKYWYGYDLAANLIKNVEITSAGDGTWTITGIEGGGGSYNKAAHWSDGERVCSPVSTTGEIFEFDAEGTYQDGTIELSFTTLPVETSNWVCDGGHSYVRETTLLLIDWSIATTGDYTSLYVTLDGTDQVRTGEYEHEYSADTNPSPENRDHVTAKVYFECLDTSKNPATPVACPWESSGNNPCPSEAVYGEYSEEALSLRAFRDNVLSQTPEGKELIRLYYQWSPTIVNTMEEDEEFKEEVKEVIDGVLPLIR